MAAFRLQALLDYRKQLEEQEMLRLAAIEGERREAQILLDDLHVRREEQCQRLDRLAQAQPLDAYRMREAVTYLGLVDAAITQQIEVLREVEARVQAQREVLMAAVRDRRALERLREKQIADERLVADRAEARRADEMVTSRFGRFGAEAVSEGI
jgi:flagellar FliJ protein